MLSTYLQCAHVKPPQEKLHLDEQVKAGVVQVRRGPRVPARQRESSGNANVACVMQATRKLRNANVAYVMQATRKLRKCICGICHAGNEEAQDLIK
eukprot:1159972-Pelagomonas_calceolata.AAC.21